MVSAKATCYVCKSSNKKQDGNQFMFCDRMYDTSGRRNVKVKSHGAHMQCAGLKEVDPEWLCQSEDCLASRSKWDPRPAQVFFEILNDGKSAKWQGTTWHLKKGLRFSGHGSRNGYPLASDIYSRERRNVHGPCCFDTPDFYECEHIGSVFPDEAKREQWRQNALETWGKIFKFKDTLVKIPTAEVPERDEDIEEKKRKWDILKIYANKLHEARQLSKWKGIIMDFYQLDMFKTYTIVNKKLEYGALLEESKVQYNSLCKSLEKDLFYGVSQALEDCEDQVQKAILGISQYLADPEVFHFAALRLMKWPAKYEVATHVDGSPYNNPTALLLEGTAILKVTEDQGVVPHKMFFGESRENGYNDPNIELKTVYLGKKPHSAIVGEHTCLWFSANFLKRSKVRGH